MSVSIGEAVATAGAKSRESYKIVPLKSECFSCYRIDHPVLELTKSSKLTMLIATIRRSLYLLTMDQKAMREVTIATIWKLEETQWY